MIRTLNASGKKLQPKILSKNFNSSATQEKKHLLQGASPKPVSNSSDSDRSELNWTKR